MKCTATFASLFLSVFTLALWAQAPPQMPKPGPEHQRLHYFVGDWETITEAKPSPFGPGGKITAKDHNVMLGDSLSCSTPIAPVRWDNRRPSPSWATIPRRRSIRTTASPRRESATKPQVPSRETLGCGHSAAKSKGNHSKDDSI